MKEQLKMDPDVWNTMDLAVEAAGGLRSGGSGNPLEAKCGCLLSVASMADGRVFPKTIDGFYDMGSIRAGTGIYAPPSENEPVLTELYRIFGMPPADPQPREVYNKNDTFCNAHMGSVSWSQFAAHYNIVPSL